MDNFFYYIIAQLLEKQNSKVVFTFTEILDILKDTANYDNIRDFISDIDANTQINNGNPYFKDAVLHLYEKSKL